MNDCFEISFEDFKNALIERHTKPVYEKLHNAKVAIAGLGGLGSNVAVSLTRAGIGELFLVDFDIVDLTNLNRQQYDVADLGHFKTVALSDKLHRINPFLELNYNTTRVTEENAAELFGGFDIVCEAFDKPENKAMLINTLLDKTNATVVSGSGMAGYLSSNTIVTSKVMNRLYLCGDRVTDAKDVNGLMAPRVAICANHEANMILRLILGETNV